MKTIKGIAIALFSLLLFITCSKDSSSGGDESSQNQVVKYDLNVSVMPEGSGTISPKSGSFNKGDQVTITATPATERFEFKNWSGSSSGTESSITITMNSDKNITANFAEVPPVYANGQGEIGVLGGTIKIEDESSPLNGLSLTIPQGALESEENISISLNESDTFPYYSEASIIKLEPSGLEFLQDVQIEIPYESSIENIEGLSVVYYDVENENEIVEFQEIVEIDEENKTITASINHFSNFLIWDRGIRLEVEMLDINGTIGAKVKVAGAYGDLDGLKYVGTSLIHDPLNLSNAFDVLVDFTLGENLYAYFELRLFQDQLIGRDQKAWSRITMQRVRPFAAGPFSVNIRDKNNNSEIIFQSGDLLESDISSNKYSLGNWFSGDPLVFMFDDFTPESNKEYFIEVDWALITDVSTYRYTPIFSWNTKGNKKKIGNMMDYSGNSINPNIDDQYQLWAGQQDSDGDGISDEQDNCPSVADPEQEDFDGDGIGDACDDDIDGDGVLNDIDQCNDTPLGQEVDADGCLVEQTGELIVNTKDPVVVSPSSIILTGEVIQDGGLPITDRGFYINYGSSTTPTQNSFDEVINLGSGGLGSFSSEYFLPELGMSITYRAFAQDNSGIVVGNPITVDDGIDPPQVVINQPTSNSSYTIGSQIVISGIVNVDPQTSLANVEIYIDGEFLEVEFGEDFNRTWDTSSDLPYGQSKPVNTPGTHIIEVIALDNIGETGSATVTIELTEETGDEDSDILFNPNLTYGSVSDVDGNTYKTIEIGTQTWMAENLRTTKYNHGATIPNITGSSDWFNNNSGAYSNYNNDENNVATYGRLYNWHAASRNICPEGWHVPTDEDWRILEIYLGMNEAEASNTGWRGTNQGGKLKEIGNNHWEISNSGATNSSGFTALPGGFRSHSGDFGNLLSTGFWWTRTQTTGFPSKPYYRYISSNLNTIGREYQVVNSDNWGRCIRCIKD